MPRKLPGRALDPNTSITVGSTTVNGNIMPSANVTYDLGNSTVRWKDLWLSGSTINLGGAAIKTDTDTGAIALIPKPTDATPNPVAMVVSPTGGITSVPTTGGVPAANAVAEAAESNTASPVPIDITSTAPANGQALIWSSAANTFVPGNVAAGGASSDIPKITGLVYPDNDTAANTSGGQTVYISGSNFAANCVVYINGSAAPSVSFISSSNVGFTTPTLSANVYPVYVINPDDGATAIHIPGLNVSGVPNWSTAAGSLGSADVVSAWSFSVAATSDSSVTYTLAGGSSLPSGISLASNGLISGTLSSPPASETTYNFSIVATDGENQDASRSFSVAVTLADPYFYLTTLLLHGDGTNDGNNNTFIESTNNLTVTKTGTAAQGSFSPFSQTGWSAYFDGTGDYLIIGASNLTASSTGKTPLAVGAGDFTIEGWFYTSNVSSSAAAIFKHYASPGTNDILEIRLVTNTVTARYRVNGGVEANLTSGTITAEQWYHVAFVRSSGVVKGYLNGTEFGSANFTGNLAATTTTTTIGCDQSGTSNFTGYIADFRFVKGTALYTNNFTPPTTALTAVSNTSLLTCESSTLIDSSTNAFTITRVGNVAVTPFSPFAPTAAYSAADVGGSVYIPAGTNGLTVANVPTIGSGDFTVEGWFWPTNDTSRTEFDSAWTTNAASLNGVTSAQGAVRTNHVFFRSNGTTDISNTSVSLGNRWNHVAWVRNGTTVTIYVNGVSSVSGTYSNSLAGGNLYISRPDSSSFRFNGWISGFRILAGTALYTGNFTPPTSAPTAVANTVALMNFTSAQIFDQTAKNIVDTFGDAKISTAQYKYGTGSIVFDGTGDYITIPNNNFFNFGSGNFTIECWVRPNAVSSSEQTLVALYGYTSNRRSWDMLMNAANLELRMDADGSAPVSTFISSTSPFTANTWHHVAFVRSGNTVLGFVNGTQVISNTFSSSLYNNTVDPVSIGAVGPNYTGFFTGHIDDLRITKGYARYTSNFTPSTSAFKDR